jgi:hypothetical protein
MALDTKIKTTENSLETLEVSKEKGSSHPLIGEQLIERGSKVTIESPKSLSLQQLKEIKTALSDAPGDKFILNLDRVESEKPRLYDEIVSLTALRLVRDAQTLKESERERESVQLAPQGRISVRNWRSKGVEEGFDEAKSIRNTFRTVKGIEKEKAMLTTVNVIEATVDCLRDVLEEQGVEESTIGEMAHQVEAILTKAASDTLVQRYGRRGAVENMYSPTQNIGSELYETAKETAMILLDAKSAKARNIEESLPKAQANLMKKTFETLIEANDPKMQQRETIITFDERTSDIVRTMEGLNINLHIEEYGRLNNIGDLTRRPMDHTEFYFSAGTKGELTTKKSLTGEGKFIQDLDEMGLDVYRFNVGDALIYQMRTGTYGGSKEFLQKSLKEIEKRISPESKGTKLTAQSIEIFQRIAENYTLQERYSKGDKEIEPITNKDVFRIMTAISAKQLGTIVDPEFPLAIDCPLNAIAESGVDALNPKDDPNAAFAEGVRYLSSALNVLYRNDGLTAFKDPRFTEGLSAALVYTAKALHECDSKGMPPVPDFIKPQSKKK